MSWVDSLSDADLKELERLGRSLDEEAFSYYLYLAVTIRVCGPIDNWPDSDAVLWTQIRHLFRVDAKGCLHIKAQMPRIVR